jgi:hypothetical protein
VVNPGEDGILRARLSKHCRQVVTLIPVIHASHTSNTANQSHLCVARGGLNVVIQFNVLLCIVLCLVSECPQTQPLDHGGRVRVTVHVDDCAEPITA